MAAYCYNVHDSKGRIFKSTCQAGSEAALRSQLKALGYAVNSIVQKPASWISKEHNSVRQRDIISMCRQFSIMYNSGLDLMDCLQTVAKENESKRLSRILHDIHDQIAKGMKTLLGAAKLKVQQGLTTAEEVRRVITPEKF